MTGIPFEADHSPRGLRRSRRDRWASPLAAIIAFTHLLSGVVLAGWFYYFAPRFKHELDDLGIKISSLTISIIGMSDLIVNYWYLLVVISPVALIIDFLVVRWTAKQLGLRFAVAYGVSISMLFVANVAVSHYVLKEALSSH